MTAITGAPTLEQLAHDLWGSIVEPFRIDDSTVYEKGSGRRLITVEAAGDTVGRLAEYIAADGSRSWAFTPNGRLAYAKVAAVVPALEAQGVRIDAPGDDPSLDDLPF